ncbi:hypothetical protein IJI31_05215 [bacterium]|nr:hypothetical protein [bacterium]
MTNSKLNSEVGKKIVEALKQQSSEDDILMDQAEVDFEETTEPNEFIDDAIPEVSDNSNSTMTAEDFLGENFPEEKPVQNFNEESTIDTAFSDDAFEAFNQKAEAVEVSGAGFEMPNNIAVLKKLISQLPSGVTRHTGAQIIKQTMEALGISMKSVLTEAQQVQESLKVSAKECQTTIQEYKKQIVALEKQSQTYQKQYGALNDLISLFIQTTK